MKIHMILLMAGFSKRFGENKLLYKIDGKPMYRYMAEVLSAVAGEQAGTVTLTAVTQHEAVRSGLKEMGIPVLWNPHSERGISSSLQIGLDALQRKGTDGETVYYAFFVGDQPYLQKKSVEDFFQAFSCQDKRIGCMSADGRPGNPVIFHEMYADELMNLSGDVGGKQVMRRHPRDIFYYPIADPRELEDVDQKEESGDEKMD
ncbi:nucleotidyltransferase family protein [Lactonifactor longoviformis]|uniref:Molybdenum cofactor cytidylyltransferase n=1 Tax=Lactonifactor longoviformis DSM 17459 TaxID=1122155 RepID=A0A1M4T2Q4_9CLOT|nr:nucleotidyltransferase family protein [Lactonifactor longoviformis]POP33667.1 nucleotidyltransferase family protein [Lactonifactor longoviformis]SHE38832.1 molybdenum cofactor cytidylyltransferase [Lactonifactor longoviformis DSM 17459]